MKTRILQSLFCILFIASGVNVYAQSATYERIDNSTRIMSYNIRNCRGMDNKTDIQRVADIISNAQPDVVALQELDSVTERNNRQDLLAQLSNLTKMYSVYGASIDFQGGKYGIGMLSKEKPLSWKRIPLPGKEEARSLLIVEFQKYIVCCTHFSLTEADRLTSIAIVNQEVQKMNKPVFIAGDFNAKPESSVIMKLQENWKILNNINKFTIPSDKPDRTIDFIMNYKVKGDTCTVLRAQVLKEPVASDHLPLFVDVRFKANQTEIFRTPAYLQNPATDAMTVMWLTNVPSHSWVEYGVDSTHMQRVRDLVEGEAMANNFINRIRLTGLNPGTKYYYRICSREITLYEPYKKEFGNTAVSSIASFTTMNPNQTDFTAIIFNDIHDNYALFDKLYQQIQNVPYNMVFFNGDCITDIQSEKNAVQSISHYSSKIKANSVPSIYLRGNHEPRGAYSMFLWNLLDRMGGHSYGAFSLGDTRFVLLDAGEDKPDDHWVYYDLNDFTQYRKDQAEFLKKELASKEFKSATKKVLIYHIPTYGMQSEPFISGKKEWGDILAKANFDICMNGHTHSFDYIQKGKEGNNFPVVIGGGNDEKSGTVMVLNKKGTKMNLKVLNAQGKELLKLDL